MEPNPYEATKERRDEPLPVEAPPLRPKRMDFGLLAILVFAAIVAITAIATRIQAVR